MNFVVTIDWKFVLALGSTAVGVILAIKMDADAAERVSTHMVDTYTRHAIAMDCDC